MPKHVCLYICCVLLLSSCAAKKTYVAKPSDGTSRTKATQRPYTVMGKRYEPLSTHERFTQSGVASWYGKDFHGKKTSNGEIYNMHAMTAAHKTLPLGVFVRVYNTKNSKETIVRVNDRGPFVKGRIIDLSYAAAKKLGVDVAGTAFVKIEALGYQQDKASGKTGYKEPATYDRGNFTVQVGAFKEQVNAERLSRDMKTLYGLSEVRQTNVNGERFFRVYVGKYSSLLAAEQAEEKLGESGYPGSFVVALD